MSQTSAQQVNFHQAVNPDNKLKKGQGVVLTCDIQAEGIFKKDITWYKDGRKTTAGLSKDRYCYLIVSYFYLFLVTSFHCKHSTT